MCPRIYPRSCSGRLKSSTTSKSPATSSRSRTRLYERAYHDKLKDRTPEDNRPEHELVVLRNTLRICWRSGHERASDDPFDRSELRIAVATALLHDLRFIPRVTEEMIGAAAAQGSADAAERLRRLKFEQRLLHMRGSAEDALNLLQSDPTLLTEAECRHCIGYISLHDLWKLGFPYPASSDWLAVCCMEGDALWPLDSEFGPLADLERKHPDLERNGVFHPDFDRLRQQAGSNLKSQLCAYRQTFAIVAERFQDQETIIRTVEGARILNELRSHWHI